MNNHGDHDHDVDHCGGGDDGDPSRCGASAFTSYNGGSDGGSDEEIEAPDVPCTGAVDESGVDLSVHHSDGRLGDSGLGLRFPSDVSQPPSEQPPSDLASPSELRALLAARDAELAAMAADLAALRAGHATGNGKGPAAENAALAAEATARGRGRGQAPALSQAPPPKACCAVM